MNGNAKPVDQKRPSTLRRTRKSIPEHLHAHFTRQFNPSFLFLRFNIFDNGLSAIKLPAYFCAPAGSLAVAIF